MTEIFNGALVAAKAEVVNVASVPQRSPFRYPGGKTWLIPRFRKWLAGLPEKPALLIEPFAGGGIITLTAVMENLVERALMVELDENVAAVWQVILSPDYRELIRRILNFEMTRERVIAELAEPPKNAIDHAFKTILRNRVQRGGIMAPGASLVKNGENGKGIGSRWYPNTLAERIKAIAQVRNRIEFRHENAVNIIPFHLAQHHAAWFIDPPYTAGGKSAGSRLYLHKELDHESLFSLMGRAQGCVMMTYDDAAEVRHLAARHGFGIEEVPMSNTHHEVIYELVLTKNANIQPPSQNKPPRKKIHRQSRFPKLVLAGA